MKEINALELKKLIDKKEDIQLIDVREEHELELCSIGGELIPMGEVMDNLDKISKTKQVIFYCRTGARSGAVCQILVAEGYTNVYNLVGGIISWSNEIDPSVTKY
ncbi:MAG: NADH oxidase [Bacteroidetes bacterium RIFCSPLOWO2_12_FULL_35_15]|nr:MAG: NADH oxidase [Bacteroidetes bacterium RIFCSPLOWO2_12_FULL_35_15]